MPAIGIRVETNQVNYVILDGTPDKPKIVVKDKLKEPKFNGMAQVLVWYREQIIQLCDTNKINTGWIRTAESQARAMGAASKSGASKRCHIEGVIIEAIASTGAIAEAGSITSLNKALKSKSAKKYIEGEDFRGIPSWDKFDKYIREAAIAGVAALSLGK